MVDDVFRSLILLSVHSDIACCFGVIETNLIKMNIGTDQICQTSKEDCPPNFQTLFSKSETCISLFEIQTGFG